MATVGRPSSYTTELDDEICDRIAGGESLRSICDSSENFPSIRSVMRWLGVNEGFRQHYARARELWADAVFEELMHIADTPQEGTRTEITDEKVKTITGDMIEHRRLQVDTRKWALARMSPKKYGDRTAHDHGGQNDNPLAMEIRHIRGAADD